jgi:hypothetical protein
MRNVASYIAPNMQKIFAIIFNLIILSACNGQDTFIESRLTTADKFIDCLKNNLPNKILDYTYPDVDDKIKNKEFRDFYVNKAYKFIKKFGLPAKDKWIIKYDLKNNFERLLITIPVFKGYDSAFNLLQADIIIVFPPPQISNKICSYEIKDMYDINKMPPIVAPKLVGEGQKNK